MTVFKEIKEKYQGFMPYPPDDCKHLEFAFEGEGEIIWIDNTLCDKFCKSLCLRAKEHRAEVKALNKGEKS